MPKASFEEVRSVRPLKTAGAVVVLICAAVVGLIYLQFRGDLAPTTRLTVLAPRAGLGMEPSSKVTLNGFAIGRVTSVSEATDGTRTAARIDLAVDTRYLSLIPGNVDAVITASTVFGNKYVALTSPENPTAQITPTDVIRVKKGGVTTEFNTLFETITDIADRVDPVQLNMTLTAAADAFTGLGDKFGRSLTDVNRVLADVNPRIPQLTHDIDQLSTLADVYTESAPDLLSGLRDGTTTARTIVANQDSLTQALVAAVGFGGTGTDVVNRTTPFLVRDLADLVPTSQLLDEYSPALLCTLRNFHDIAPKISDALGKNGYASNTATELIGATNPYVYPDNLPRVNARGGPGGRPGCWQPISRDLWPAPYLVMDTGASIAPYNHFELGQPIATEYVWGRQIGENTINP